jgi:hypothetical protein
MDYSSPYYLDCSESLLSAFDISGSLLFLDNRWQFRGIKYDFKQLMHDLDVLEKDYRNAIEKVAKDLAK